MASTGSHSSWHVIASQPATCLSHFSLIKRVHFSLTNVNAVSVGYRANKEADKAAAAAAKEARLRVMQERLAAWQASQAK